MQTHWSKIGVKSVGEKRKGRRMGPGNRHRDPSIGKAPESYSVSAMSDTLRERGKGTCGLSLAVLLSWTTSVRCCQSKTAIFLKSLRLVAF